MTPDLQACLEGRYDESEAMIRKFGDPASPRVKFALGFHELRAGHLVEGMKLLDAGRWIDVWGSKPLGSDAPILRSHTDLRGKTVLLRLEGGVGDEIVGARFARHLSERGAKVILGCRHSLRSLLGRIDGVMTAVAHQGAKWVLHDYWLPGMSAPHVLELAWEDLWKGPFLSPCIGSIAKWDARISDPHEKLRVGIRWRGLPAYEHEQYRRFDPAPLFSLGSMPGVATYSLQRDEGAEMLPPDSGVRDLSSQLKTWEDTAAAIMQMDVVISSCTAVAHLAASLGVQTWVLVPAMPYYLWAWPMDTNKSPWYGDNLVLFRAEKLNEWDEVLAAVVAAVAERAACRMNAGPKHNSEEEKAWHRKS